MNTLRRKSRLLSGIKYNNLGTSRHDKSTPKEPTGVSLSLTKQLLYNLNASNYRKTFLLKCLQTSKILPFCGKLGDFRNEKIIKKLNDQFSENCPHLRFHRDIFKICDLTKPELMYHRAREIKRKIIYHSGPTNSGKTYTALKSLAAAPTGVYCGPLRLLASEIFHKLNSQNVPCDLVTGEDRRFGTAPSTPAQHISCTIEMVSTNTKYEVGIIDEIQMIGDAQRGWAWTNALLGLYVSELHVCGDHSAVDLVRSIAAECRDEFEVKEYQRLSKLTVQKCPLNDLTQLQAGDCLVAFSRKMLLALANRIHKKWECSIIYGALPPEVKLAQARKFNDQAGRGKILLATNAIGMGLNLNIRRIVYLTAHTSQGDVLSVSEARQISGRAGRYSLHFESGSVTAINEEHLCVIRDLMSQPLPKTKRAVVVLTREMVQLLSYYLPSADLADIIQIFELYVRHNRKLYELGMELSTLKELSGVIRGIPLDPIIAYHLCCAPVPRNETADKVFTEIAKFISRRQVMNSRHFAELVEFPPPNSVSLSNLPFVETMHDCVDLYIWLSYRFPMNLPDQEKVRAMYSIINETIKSTLNTVFTAKKRRLTHL